MQDRKTLVAIPMYNCAKQIVRVLADLQDQALSLKPYKVDLLILDNCSQDDSYQAANGYLKNICFPYSLEKNDFNLGLGGTQKRAFHWAYQKGYKALVVLHGDHQASAKDLPFLLEKLESSSDAAVLGSRFSLRSRRIGYSRVRTIGNVALNLIYSALSGRRISDLGSGLNAFKVSYFMESSVKDFSDGFTFNMDLLLSLIDRNLPFSYVPITWTEYDQVSNAKNLKVGWSALKILLKWKIS